MYYILDTSVILSDPKALERLGDRHVILPLVVLTELESKRTHPELGYPARTALRYLEALRDKGSLTESITTPQGGSVKVEINHISEAGLPEVLSAPINDNRILAVAFNLKNEGHDVILMSKDLPMRLKASVAGIQAEDVAVIVALGGECGLQPAEPAHRVIAILTRPGIGRQASSKAPWTSSTPKVWVM